MSGHSKWANIKHKKAREDARKGKLFTKLGKKIALAAREGGGDPEANVALRIAIDQAKEANMPNDNIERAIKRGTGDLEGVSYEELTYEGYGPSGVAVLLDVLTDNKNRAAAEIRHIFSRHDGSLGEAGCVAWMFEKCGLIVIEDGTEKYDEDEVMLAALEAGAVDVKTEENNIEIYTAPQDLQEVKKTLAEAGLELSIAEVTMVPQSTVHLEGRDAEKFLKLYEALKDHDDVQEVYANFDISDEELERLSD